MKSDMSKEFQRGYTDGWQTIKPGTVPPTPTFSVPPGMTAYQHGFDLGRKAARLSLGAEPRESQT